MEEIKLTGRNSALSLLQLAVVKEKIIAVFPEMKVEIIARSSRGDALQNIPLQTVEGSDFFTQDIFNMLSTGEADIAVHSLKDMSSEHFFGSNHFAVVDREDVRDVAIFNEDVLQKLKNGNEIIIGTCSPRREEMAVDFLQKALPQTGAFSVTTKIIRGNVDTRLKKLSDGEYDGILLATAGLNRMLASNSTAEKMQQVLRNKLLMLLPLIECVPAPCQGAIVAEAYVYNDKAKAIIAAINNPLAMNDCVAEKQTALRFGVGCLQKFGVTTIATKRYKTIYAAGKNTAGNSFSNWNHLPELNATEAVIFSSTDYMKDFFNYQWNETIQTIKQSVIFVSNYKALNEQSINSSTFASNLNNKTILASGTRTWLQLAKQGYWVTASADGLGFEFLLPSLQMPLLKITAEQICIITHEEAAKRWQKKGYASISNYVLKPAFEKNIIDGIAAASIVFWTSYGQYQHYSKFCKQDVIHACPGGETAVQLQQLGLEPVIFPTIKAFEQWRKSSTPSHNVA
jgi:hydroxymethylbilane synthase